jgi:hypothetical protein
MQDISQTSRLLQVTLKLTALFCGGLLIAISILSGNVFPSESTPSQFLQQQVHLLVQLKWFIGVLFIAFGILFTPRKVLIDPMYSGPKDIGHDAYKLYLVNKYGIEKNSVLDQLTCRQRLFPSVAEALIFAHELECANEYPGRDEVSTAINVSGEPQPISSPVQPIESTPQSASLLSPFVSQVMPPPVEKRYHLIFLIGLPLLTLLFAGLYYTNTFRVKEEVAVVVGSVPQFNADQVVTSNIPANIAPSAESSTTEAPAKSTVVPINELWVGSWTAAGSKQRLVVTSSNFKYGNDDFTWAGVRPKGIIQCCPAFYEGSTSKAELLERIGQPAPNVALKGDQQKTLDIVKTLSEGNFKKIVLADPFLRKYFFIYDQNTIYRINRDLGDSAELVVEPFRKQE